MAELKKIATRDSYGSALAALGQEHEDIVVFDADLSGATKTAVFKKAFRVRNRFSRQFSIDSVSLLCSADGRHPRQLQLGHCCYICRFHHLHSVLLPNGTRILCLAP